MLCRRPGLCADRTMTLRVSQAVARGREAATLKSRWFSGCAASPPGKGQSARLRCSRSRARGFCLPPGQASPATPAGSARRSAGRALQRGKSLGAARARFRARAPRGTGSFGLRPKTGGFRSFGGGGGPGPRNGGARRPETLLDADSNFSLVMRSDFIPSPKRADRSAGCAAVGSCRPSPGRTLRRPTTEPVIRTHP
jgi:hypothetical protein